MLRTASEWCQVTCFSAKVPDLPFSCSAGQGSAQVCEGPSPPLLTLGASPTCLQPWPSPWPSQGVQPSLASEPPHLLFHWVPGSPCTLTKLQITLIVLMPPNLCRLLYLVLPQSADSHMLSCTLYEFIVRLPTLKGEHEASDAVSSSQINLQSLSFCIS